jgi:hypothetical protein
MRAKNKGWEEEDEEPGNNAEGLPSCGDCLTEEGRDHGGNEGSGRT